MTRDVTILRAHTAADRYGDSSKTWTSATSTVTKGWLSQASSQEPTSPGRVAEVTTWQLYLPAGTDIEASDRVVIDGTTYEVDGPPNRARRPSGEHHVEARLRRVEA